MEHKSLEQPKDRAAVVELEERVAPSPRELRRMRLKKARTRDDSSKQGVKGLLRTKVPPATGSVE